MKDTLSQEQEAWKQAMELLVRYDAGEGHLDTLLDAEPNLQLRWLVLQVFREWYSVETVLKPRLRRQPRPRALNLLRMALAECLCRSDEQRPKVVHFTVETARALKLSKAEGGFINGVLRTILREGSLDKLQLSDSHPDWLLQRWKRQFGEAATKELVVWNQSLPEFHVSAKEQPIYAEESQWPGFYKVKRPQFREAIPDLQTGTVYFQDPFTRIPVELLSPKPGERIVDLCAAPGGKSRLIAQLMKNSGNLYLVDRPGPRLERLRENMQNLGIENVTVIPSTIEDLETAAGEEPGLGIHSMDGILIDVPCSNTGVIQKRPDVKISLTEDRIRELAKDQLELLKSAARWVRPGGRLVYSTCSLEREENEEVVEAFLADVPGFELTRTEMSLPWSCRHDGGGAFLLTMVTAP